MNKHYGYIYKIVCKLNGKIYIGQTIRSISDRWKSHIGDAKKLRRKDKMAISRAIYKYGSENFTISAICHADNQEDLNNREMLAIRIFKSIENGYNVHEGGRNQRLSKETREKISRGNKGKKRTKAYADNVRKRLTGIKLPESTKIKISMAQKQSQKIHPRKHSKETRSKISNSNKGIIRSKEWLKNMSDSRIGKKVSEVTKEKLKIKRIGRKPSSVKVLCLENNTTYSSIKEASEVLRISIHSLGKHLKGKLKTAQGYTFKYLD